AYHLRGIGLAVVGRDFDLVGAVDDVIVGHGITVSRNEEARTLTGHGAPAQARGQSIRSGEAAEETLHRRARLARRVIVLAGAIVLAGDLLVDVDLDRNHRRLHALDDIGKADRLRHLADFVVDLRMRRAGENISRALRRAKTINGDAEAGDDGSHQREFARGEQRAPWRTVRWKRGKVGGSFGHFSKSPRARI